MTDSTSARSWFDWTNPYPTTRAPVFARNIVATSQPLAASAGLAMMRQGGNAVDAAIAGAAAISLTEPCSNGLGSDNFAIVWDGSRLHGLNASGTAPATWTPEYFHRRYGTDPAARPMRGWDTVTVPGAVAGWAALHQRFGRLSFEQVLAPAIEYAERGFAVSPIVQDKWRQAAPLLAGLPGFDQHFLPRGRAPEVGEHFVLAGAARALKRIAESCGEDFYRGQIAQAIASFARDGGGTLGLGDLDRYRPVWVEPISQTFAGCELHEIPPNGQGIAALMCLGILAHTELADCRVDTADWHHLMIEAMKLAFADVNAQVADPAAMRVTAEELLDPGRLRQRARLIDRARAQVFAPATQNRGGTIYLAAADAGGMMVSLIQSNYMGFGSGIVVPGFGVSLQNRGFAFSLDPDHPNCVAPGKRPFHTIIPAMLTRDGQAQMSFGVMGGNMQPQGHVQTLTRMLLARQQPQAACDAPRWKWNAGLDLEVESAMPPPIVAELQRRGHHIVSGQDSYMDFGAGQMIWRLGDPGVDGYVAASDSRRDGQACGF
ncbi:MAG TPA: gamma-glutamyltransferase family protein [Burkholderiaceae bacterium]|jgi:gamma-glutamyltranspeptidase/glutathione hydrolase|nr:gamma-glutamyltransferase family protein [Burkholderiaceae bacterium]